MALKGQLVGAANPRWRSDAPFHQCQTCGKTFRVPWWRLHENRGVFCSLICRNRGLALRRKNKPGNRSGQIKCCKNCGSAVYINPRRLKVHKNFYCSKKCEGEWRRGPNNSFYGKRHTNETLKLILQRVHSKPNGTEKQFIKICNDHGLPFRYVGDGNLIINGMNPDFVNTTNPSHIIETFGRYWHEQRKTPFHKSEWGKMLAYENLGYRCLVLWEEELRDSSAVVRKVRAYFGLGKGLEVVS